MNWAFYTFAVLWIMGLGLSLAEHGSPKTGKNNFWITLISVGINFMLLLKATNII